MRTAICHYSFHRRWKRENWTPERLAAEVAALGVEGVDFHAGLLGEPTGAAERVRAAVDRERLVLSGLSLSNNFNQDEPDAFAAQVAGVKTWLAVAADVGAPVSRIFGGGLPAAERRDPAARAARRARILEGLRAVVEEAETRGVVLALENHGGLPCTAEEQAEIIEAVGSPYLRATVDVGNYMQGGQEGHEAARIAAPYCAYVHLKDFRKVPDADSPWGWTLEACTVGDGDVDHRACLAALEKAGYEGFVALEYEGTEPEETGVPRSVAAMQQWL